MGNYYRINRDKLFMSMATLVAQRSTCDRAHVGAVIVRDGRVISMGYGGAPAREPHCHDVGCQLGPEGGCIRTVHAEANAIAFAAKHGVALDGAEIYITHQPCFNCSKLIVNAGIKRVYYRTAYRDPSGVELLKKCKVYVEWYQDEDVD